MNQIKILKSKNAIVSLKKILGADNKDSIEIRVKQFDNMTGDRLEDGVIRYDLNSLEERKALLQEEAKEIEVLLKSVK